MKNLDSFFTAYCNEFWHYEESIINELSKKNKEYSAMEDFIENKLKEYSNLRSVLEDSKIIALNNDEVKVLIEILDKYMQIRDIELEEMFFVGGRNAFYYFSKMGIFQNDNYIFNNIKEEMENNYVKKN
ncbi:MAG: hypothetical protein Q4E39_00895 [bacterium]|nr:hypothetical protein [bacterium]